MTDNATQPGGRRPTALRRLVEPFRRRLARFALVDEERRQREAIIAIHGAAINNLNEELRGVVAGVNEEIRRLSARIEHLAGEIDAGFGARADVTIKELWRRLEFADAEQTTAIQRMQDDVERILAENAAIRALLEPEPIATDAPIDQIAPRPTSKLLFRELNEGRRSRTIEKLAALTGVFRGHDPVVNLGCGRGEFLEVAAASGLAAYGVDDDPEAAAFCTSLGLDARNEDPFQHLSSLDAGSVAGVLCSGIVERIPAERLSDLLSSIARVLSAGGVAVVQTANPRSVVTHIDTFWRDPAHLRPVPASTLAFAARSAGLVADDVIYLDPVPDDQRLKSIESGSDDPYLAKIVDGLNAALVQLNDLLYGPAEYALVTRKPE